MADAKPKDIETIAYVVHKPKEDFVLENVVLDEMRDDEVLVDMKFSGICHTVCSERKQYTNSSHSQRTGPRLPTRGNPNLQIPSHLRPRRSRHHPRHRA